MYQSASRCVFPKSHKKDAGCHTGPASCCPEVLFALFLRVSDLFIMGENGKSSDYLNA